MKDISPFLTQSYLATTLNKSINLTGNKRFLKGGQHIGQQVIPPLYTNKKSSESENKGQVLKREYMIFQDLTL